MDPVKTFGSERPVIGMVHLPPLPGAPGFDGDREHVRGRALRDGKALAAGGVDAVMVENFGDTPYHPEEVPKHTVASMTALVDTVAGAVDLPVGDLLDTADGVVVGTALKEGGGVENPVDEARVADLVAAAD